MVKAKQTVWEAKELRDYVSELVQDDPRFVGLSRYIVNIQIFWSRSIKTACAGHGFIFFNPDFWDEIPKDTRVTVLVHEVWHLILKHLERGKNFDPYMYNIAADHVINLSLEADGFTFEGTDPYKDPKYIGMSTEQVYNAIYQMKPKNRPKPNLKAHVSAQQIEDMVEEVLEADAAGKTLKDQKKEAEEQVNKLGPQPGDETGSMGIRLERTNEKVAIIDATYEKIFKDYLIDPLGGRKRTFMRPNRRQHALRGSRGSIRLPGRMERKGHKNRLTHLVYALDVSGSISAKQAQQFHDSVRTIKELLNPKLLTVIFFDTHIKLQKTFRDTEEYSKIYVQAGGGTSLTRVYERVDKLDPEALVIFTDLEVPIPPKPRWETIWLIPDKRNVIPPNLYGEVYLIPEDKR